MNNEWFKQLGDFIARVGFPIAVAAWLLWEIHSYAAELIENQLVLKEMLKTLLRAHGIAY